jgi:hypothetical protein
MLDQISPRRGALELYVDAGPLARDIGYAAGRVRLPEIPLLLFAGALLGVVLARFDTSLGSRQLLFATVGAVVVITGLCWSGPVRGRFGWLLPAIVRIIEYAFVTRTTVVVAEDLQWLAYTYLVVIAFHHTDSVARMRHAGRGPARWVYTAGLGYDGRMLTLAALALSGTEAYRRGLPIMVALLAVVYVSECAISWLRTPGGRALAGRDRRSRRSASTGGRRATPSIEA